MRLAEMFRPTAVPQGFKVAQTASPDRRCHADCSERFRLRAEYIRRLAEFTEAANLRRIGMRAGMEGPAAAALWKNVKEKSAASSAAWARYRKHKSDHGPRPSRAVEIGSAA